MNQKDENTDIQPDSDVEVVDGEEVTEESLEDGETEDVPEDPREAIANKIAEERDAEMVEADEISEDDLDPDLEKIVLKIDGKEVEVTQEELERNFQLDQSARKKMTENAELQKQLNENLAEVARLKAQALTQPTPVQEPKPEVKPKIDFADLTVKIREGSDEEAVEALKILAESQAAQTPELPDVGKIVDARLEELNQKTEQERAEAEAEAFKVAEQQFGEDFKNDISESGDFFELAAMEDRKLVNDPEWQGKLVGERLTEAGERARKWLNRDSDNSQSSRRQKQKQRHAPRRSASRRTNIGKDQEPESRTSVIEQMKKSRGQLV